MKIKAISDIPNAAFYSLKTWAESSSTNLNMLVGIGFILIIIGAILVYFYTKKIGKEDEYSRKIYYKSTVAMLWTIVICDIIFPKTYMWNQFFMFKYALALIIAGLKFQVQVSHLLKFIGYLVFVGYLAA
ncbi:hypothetical protein ABQD95_14355, partial [Enterococcus avium]|uniref:hypothetical protein n=1 Tax=Enterococcus avium TaxID=33945 RepID=UPI00288DF6C6